MRDPDSLAPASPRTTSSGPSACGGSLRRLAWSVPLSCPSFNVQQWKGKMLAESCRSAPATHTRSFSCWPHGNLARVLKVHRMWLHEVAGHQTALLLVKILPVFYLSTMTLSEPLDGRFV